ncbi:MAG: DUF308 domain-containing protein [Clostridiales bacterium]|jgi:hypothetical protein|nr:DUF308 domain-containing protein [Clostridiales bacterium]
MNKRCETAGKVNNEKHTDKPFRGSSASELVRLSYSKLRSCRAVVSEKISVVTVVGLAYMILGALAVIGYGCQYRYRGGSFIALITGGFILILAGGVLIFLIKRYTNISDAYLLRRNGKNIVFYINKKYTIYYCGGNGLVCVDNRRNIEKEYFRDDFMSAKLGYGRMTGNMEASPARDGGYKIKTARVGRMTSRLSGKSVLWIDKESLPIKILTADGYVYKFVSLNDPDMRIFLPKELLEACGRRGIEPPKDESIAYR